jgi:uncharacterized protein
MKCPVCSDSTLAMSNRAGIEIDYCPSCRGVWLDRGELDKIIERTSIESSAPAPAPEPDIGGRRVSGRYDDDDDERYRDPSYRGRKRKGFLGDLFDFD